MTPATKDEIIKLAVQVRAQGAEGAEGAEGLNQANKDALLTRLDAAYPNAQLIKVFFLPRK